MKGRIEVTTHFLEMKAVPPGPPRRPPSSAQVQVQEAKDMAPNHYRRLYEAVGAPWLWYERSQLADVALKSLIEEEGVHIHILMRDGEEAGYTEIRYSQDRQAQILYFGLKSAFIGAGLGHFFLDWTVRQAFAQGIDRLWVHTCSLDHRRALATYQKAGFTQYRQETGWVRIPEDAIKRQQESTAV